MQAMPIPQQLSVYVAPKGSPNRIGVYVVDDSDSIRQRLASMLANLTDVDIVGEARGAQEAIDGIAATGPDVVLLDLNLAAGSGMDVLRSLGRKLHSPIVVVLTNHSEPQYRNACLKAGARHFFDKSTQFDCVKTVISDIKANATGNQP